jgi:hypothetical protein
VGRGDISLRDLRYFSEMASFYQNVLAIKNILGVTGGKPIAVYTQSVPGVSTVTLSHFYDIHGRKGEVLFFSFLPNTTRDIVIKYVVSN